MFFYREERQTPIIQAIIGNDLEVIKSLKDSKSALLEKNFFGFDALEMAKLLGSSECLNLLNLNPKNKIKVIAEGERGPKLISQNQFAEIFKVRYTDSLRFKYYSTFKKVITSCPKNIQDSCDYKIGAMILPALSIQWIDKYLGYGLFADQDFEEGSFVGEYTGLVRQIYPLSQANNEYCLLYPRKFFSFKYFIIDSKDVGNEIRFANHSFEPNLSVVAIVDKGLVHTYFFTNKAVSKGSQLTWNYGLDYWSRRDPPVEI